MQFARAALIAFAAGLIATPQAGAVYHGRPVHAGDAPWLVLMRHDGISRCGGALIAADRIVTAAHCVVGLDVRKDRFLIGDGAIGRLLHVHARGVKIDRRYREMPSPVRPSVSADDATVNDVAVIVLERPVEEIQPIALARTAPARGERITAFGRGTGSPVNGDRPSAAPELARSPSTCARVYGRLFFRSRHACTSDSSSRNAQTCDGDSGSPLVVTRNDRPELASIVTWGAEARGHGCGAHLPDVSELVAPHREFLLG